MNRRRRSRQLRRPHYKRFPQATEYRVPRSLDSTASSYSVTLDVLIAGRLPASSSPRFGATKTFALTPTRIWAM